MTALMIRESAPSRYGVSLTSDCFPAPDSVTAEAEDGKRATDMNFLLFAPTMTMPTWAFEPSQYWHALSPTYVVALFDSRATEARTNAVVEDMAYPEWFALAQGKKDSLTLAELGNVVDGITRDLYAKKFKSIDRALASANPSQMSADAIVAVARVTYSAKESLGHWSAFVRRSKEALHHRGQPEKTLAGL